MGKDDPVVFLDKDGSPLPEWLQGPLERQWKRLARDFPRLNDPAVIQDLLDGVGQRVLEKTERAEPIDGIESFVATATKNAATSAMRGVDIYVRGQTSPEGRLPGIQLVPEPLHHWWGKLLEPDEEEFLIRHLLMGDRHEEIAQKMGLPVSTVRTRYSRVIGKLRGILAAPSSTRKGPRGAEAAGEQALKKKSWVYNYLK